MYTKILVAADGSEFANRAVGHAATLAKAIGATLTIVNVTQLWSALDIAHAAEAGVQDPVSEYETMAAEAARRTLDAAAATAKAAGATAETLHIRDQAPADGIIAAARDQRSDLIVMGTHGRRGLGRLLLGSQTAEVLALSKIPVLVVR